MNMYRIGKLNDGHFTAINENKENEMKTDFQKLRTAAIEMVSSLNNKKK